MNEYTRVLNEYKIERPRCKCCGEDIIYNGTKAYYSDIKKRLIIKGKSYLTIKNIEGEKYGLKVCQKCIESKYKINNINRIFNVMAEPTKFAFSIPDEVYKKARTKYALTKNKMIEKHGEALGIKKWEDYCNRQAETNSFEYKNRVYGMTKKEFDEFNKSRAVTKNNLIKKYGEKKGIEMWNSYLEKQRITKSWDYMVSNYGEEKAKKINASKVVSKENFIKKYGEKLGIMKWESHLKSYSSGYSIESQKIFKKIDNILYGFNKKYETFFATKNYEYPITGKDYVYKLDYYIPQLKICIEYNGSCFHGDPRIYEDQDCCNPFDPYTTAKDLREKDFIRYKNLKTNHDITTIIIWELDAKNPNFDLKQFIKENLNF